MPHVDFPQSRCLAALARCDITPPVGIYHRMWGAATHDRSTGVHRPLLATALALSPTSAAANDPAQVQVLVGVDHCLLWNEPMQRLRSAVARAAALGLDQVHVAMSHTHAAGLMDPARANLPGGDLIGPYLEELAGQLADIVRRCIASLQPARIVYGTDRCGLAANRDFWDADHQLFACGYNPDGPADDTLLVARIADDSDRTLGTLVNYACHPTTLAWQNTLISPDYIGAMREVVESATAAPCLFLQGASGDLGPRQGYVGDVGVADRNGRQLGYAALAALEALPPPGVRFEYAGPVISGATLGTWDYRPLPPELLADQQRWQATSFNIELSYRPDLPTAAEAESRRAHFEREEQAAVQRGDVLSARDCHAQAERMARTLARLAGLPPGDQLPVPVRVWRLGDAFWVLLPGEYYNVLQRALRERFPKRPLVVATVTDGWQPGYVPPAETYGRGLYQESVALVAPGSLERVIAEVGDRLADWND